MKLLSYIKKGVKDKRSMQIGYVLSENNNMILPLKLTIDESKLRGDGFGRRGGLIDLIDNPKEMKNIMKQIKEFKINENEDTLVPISKVNQIPIIPRRNLICIGKNYLDHIKEVAKVVGLSSDVPKYPIFFTKVPDTIVGPSKNVESHSDITSWLDYEAELAIVIGKEGKNIKPEDALNFVFGYTVANDITSRDIQKKHVQWFKGKTLDTSCPMAAAVLLNGKGFDPQNLSIKLWLNGELKQSSNTSNMIFNVATIISELSKGFTLKPGDIILTGTPDGVGYPQQIALKSGDKMEIEIEKVGSLVNYIK